MKVKLDRTVFYPQGGETYAGGQPSDIGFLHNSRARFQVKAAELDKGDDNVWHVGEFLTQDRFAEGEEVTCEIDEVLRRLHARLHSGGHLIDMAVGILGLALKPSKGIHYPGNSAVEYFGNVENDQREGIVKRLNEEMGQIQRETEEDTSITIYSYEQAQGEIEIPDYLPAGRDIRYVRLAGRDKGSPCGGTHVKHVREIGDIRITKIQKKGKALRFSYELLSPSS